ncbi:MAG: hypothetical protein IPN34_22185 [Planctomycetes bacterium]|nr:hypothetical protein [Planctomycetota bacterium]
MIALGLALLALGSADFIAGGLSGTPRDRRHIARGLLASGLPLLALVTLSGGRWSACAYALLALAGIATWLFVRRESAPPSDVRNEERRASRAIAVFLLLLLALALLAPLAPCRPPRWLLRALEGHPLPLFQATNAEALIAVLGILALLAAPANALIRAILRASGTQIDRSAKRLRGGRTIGMLERWLIFGFALAGEPTAAALVVSAKSLVRFPELQAARTATAEEGAQEIDHVTEYFLLGSLASWFVALVPAVVLR